MKYKNIFVTKKQRPELEKPINEEIFLTKLIVTIHFRRGRVIRPLPSATFSLPSFKILPLPFPLTSRAALGRPAKINKPIVK